MASHTKIGFTLVVSLLFTAFLTVKSHPSKAGQAESEKIAATVPIADLHAHDGFGLSRENETGVVWAGSGSRRGDRSQMFALKGHWGNKFIAWAGQDEFNTAYNSGGMAEMMNPDNSILVELYNDSEEDLKDGEIVGIGEIFINNQTSSKNPSWRRKGQVDAPVIRKFFDLVAKYDGFLGFHMQADTDSMEQLGNLLASNRKGRVLWNHCGTDTSASEVRSMMDKHPNLFCELSFRYPPVNYNLDKEIFNSGGIHGNWRELMEDHSDRFMVGTDAHNGDEFVEAIKTVREGLLPNLKPDTARKIAYQNAQRLFGLKDIPKQ